MRDDKTIHNSKRNGLVNIFPSLRIKVNNILNNKNKEILLLQKKAKASKNNISNSSKKAKIDEIEKKYEENLELIRLLDIEHLFKPEAINSLSNDGYGRFS